MSESSPEEFEDVLGQTEDAPAPRVEATLAKMLSELAGENSRSALGTMDFEQGLKSLDPQEEDTMQLRKLGGS
jgi:hypothetical protein